MVKYTLHYFAGRGAGEVVRQVFHLAGQEFEDKRYTHAEWPAHKAEMPFGQMPVLEVDGKKLGQSLAIARYVAKQFGLAGKGDWDQAQVDALADQWKDFTSEIRPYIVVLLGFQQGDLNKLKEDTFLPAVKKHFVFFTNYLKNNSSGFFVGDSATYVDLLIAEFVATAEAKAPEALADFPEIKAHSHKVHAIPQIKKWRESRPETPF